MSQSVRVIKIATRESALALWQAEHVALRIQIELGIATELVPMTTRGDQIQDKSLAQVGGKGLFLKELEVAMLEKRADIAVHSLKDVPMQLDDGFTLAAILERADPYDALVSRNGETLTQLAAGARIGSSSLRRLVQLRQARPDLLFQNIRGNVNTRLRKLDEGEFDGLILACAGLERLGFSQRISERLAPELCLPAVGQGAICIEATNANLELIALLQTLGDAQTTACVTAERAMNLLLHGSCEVPIAGFAQIEHDTLTLRGLVGSVDSDEIISAYASGAVCDATAIGRQVAKLLLAQGAEKLLKPSN